MGQMLNSQPVVLCIEDCPSYGQIIRLTVERLGGMAFVAEDFNLANIYAQNLKFDLVTVDLNIAEEFSGIELINRINFNDKKYFDSVPKMVVITGQDLTDTEKQRIKKMGYADVLQKPVYARTLASYLNTAAQEEASRKQTSVVYKNPFFDQPIRRNFFERRVFAELQA